MRWIDTSLIGIGALVLITACSDDGLAPADSNAAGSTSHGETDQGSGGGGETGSGASDETGELDPGTSTGAGTGGDGSDGSGDSTGEPPPSVCEMPEDDCVVVSDCCRCEVFAVGEPVPECRESCRQPMCDALGVPPDLGPACEDDECGWEPRNCGDGLVTCDVPTPGCEDGLLPEVTPDGSCWTGACVPVEACEGVPSCDYCEADETCVTTETQVGPLYECVPVPDACMGTPTCECMPPQTCEAPFDTCSDDEGTIDCSCPAC